MSLAIPFVIVVLIALSTGGVIIFQKNGEVKKAKNHLEEALWVRRNKIPLLLEIIGAHLAVSDKASLIELRAKTMSNAFRFEEKIVLEREASTLLKNILEAAHHQEDLKPNTLFNSLSKEFEDDLETIHIAANDLDYQVEQLARNINKPWFIIWKRWLSESKILPVGAL